MVIENENVTVTVTVNGPFDFYTVVTALETALLDTALARTVNDDGTENKSKAALYCNLKRTGMLAMLAKRG